MFSKCGNPACNQPFGPTKRGGFFVTDTPAGTDSAYMVDVELTAGRKCLYFFWLCDRCSRLPPPHLVAGVLHRERGRTEHEKAHRSTQALRHALFAA